MGQSLVTIKLQDSVYWVGTDGVAFKDSPNVTWFSNRFLRSALEDYADAHYWSDDIIEYTPPQYQLAKPNGGYCRLDFGEIGLSLDVFSGQKAAGNSLWTDTDAVFWSSEDTVWDIETLTTGDVDLWPPPREIYITHNYTEAGEDALSLLFEGTGYLAGFDREVVKYDLYGRKYDQDLLEVANNYNGDEVPLPRALGEVSYVVPVRLEDDALTHPTYHSGYLAGTIRVDWHVFDDGVNIDSNAFDNGDGTFYLDATPVGEVTISGTGALETLSDVINWACQADRSDYMDVFAGLALSYTYDSSLETNPSPSLSYWASSQGIVLDFLSEISAYFRHLFYISAYAVFCVDMDTANGSRTLTEYDFFGASYQYDSPISILRSSWNTREAVEESIGVYVKETENEATVSSDYPYGSDNSETPYEVGVAPIEASLEAIMGFKHKTKVSIEIPISSDLPAPGELITFTDESSYNLPLTVVMFCRSIRYDAENDVISIQGDGVLS